jgi:hypothetical protein
MAESKLIQGDLNDVRREEGKAEDTPHVAFGRQPEDLTLERLRMKLPMSWIEPRRILFACARQSQVSTV